jgi:hypothetical protein
MEFKCIKYRLTSEGTIPDFLYLEQDGVGGIYGVDDPKFPWPRNLVQIGFTNFESGDFEVISTKQDLVDYLTSVSSDWTQQNPIDNSVLPFDVLTQSDWVWDRLDALNTNI